MAVTPTIRSLGRTPLKPAGTVARGFGRTSRTDRWTFAPTAIGLGLAVFVVYALFSAFVWGPVFGGAIRGGRLPLAVLLAAHRRRVAAGWLSPAIFILWIPLGFRTTCYAFRRAYYRSYFADPPACAVGEPTAHRRYAMEARFPLILQNLHRIFLYLQFIPLAFLWLDAILALHPAGAWRFGLGNVILFADLVLLTGYSLSCHSLRHFVGGRLDCFSCSARNRARRSVWQRLTTSTATTSRLGPGACSRSGWPTCTSGCWPSASSTTRRSGCESRARSGIPTTSW